MLIADLLKGRGFTAVTARSSDQLGKSDEEQLAYATSHRKALLTHNRHDFEALHQTYLNSGKTHHGMILAMRHPPYEMVRRLMRILNHVTADEMISQIRYI